MHVALAVSVTGEVLGVLGYDSWVRPEPPPTKRKLSKQQKKKLKSQRSKDPNRESVRWKRMVGIDILDGIGSTEMLHIFISNREGDIRYGSSGKPVPG